jgi:hypothetical protein
MLLGTTVTTEARHLALPLRSPYPDPDINKVYHQLLDQTINLLPGWPNIHHS